MVNSWLPHNRVVPKNQTITRRPFGHLFGPHEPLVQEPAEVSFGPTGTEIALGVALEVGLGVALEVGLGVALGVALGNFRA